MRDAILISMLPMVFALIYGYAVDTDHHVVGIAVLALVITGGRMVNAIEHGNARTWFWAWIPAGLGVTTWHVSRLIREARRRQTE